jgi:hypothetical protein
LCHVPEAQPEAGENPCTLVLPGLSEAEWALGRVTASHDDFIALRGADVSQAADRKKPAMR